MKSSSSIGSSGSLSSSYSSSSASFSSSSSSSSSSSTSSSSSAPMDITFDDAVELLNKYQDPDVDTQLMDWFKSIIEKRSLEHFEFLLASSLAVSDIDYEKYPALQSLPFSVLKLKLAVIKAFNLQYNVCAARIRFEAASQEEGGLAYKLMRLRNLLFLSTKQGYLSLVPKSYVDMGAIYLNRRKAQDSVPPSKNCLFMQAYRQIANAPLARFRLSGQPFSVYLKGEGATDAGGPFREAMQSMISEVQSSTLPLFVRTPNGAHNVGAGRDRNIPNPFYSSYPNLNYFRFIGKLMGMAIASKNPLPFSLSSVTWKYLVGMSLDRKDLEEVDLHCCKSLETLLEIEKEGITEETFADTIFFNFTTNSIDGREIELIPNGKDIDVSWNNRSQYAKLVEEYKLNECKSQMQALYEGLASVVPIGYLRLLLPKELEQKVCGNPDVDIGLLKQNTNYSDCSATDPHIQNFWSVLEDFTVAERQLFLRFVWGRTTLPATSSDFTSPFEITPFYDNSGNESGSGVDSYMPVSHTCGFSLELPAYSTKEIMREKLLYAITNCKDIDLDFVPAEEQNEDDSDF
eukprot:TRINITY_DN3219_c0_g1_i3.p1 TRINITY_DN3219_c0_g1~~TRINITY_DN3219_c0_g1_i3.p1  ORF type:complete len:573 (+),score=161.90 TRINITY_DN3219_c0_g1_i3:1015-2733(+)